MSDTQNRSNGRSDASQNHPTSNRKRKKRKRKKSMGFKILIAVIVIIIFAIVGAVVGTVFGILNDTQALNIADVTPASYTSLIYDVKGNEIDKLHGDENREYVELDLIPKHLQQAIIAIEDERFYEHGGIDIKGIGRALLENIKTFSLSQGASTITQQLIKNEALDNEKKLTRKIKEQYMAINLEDSLEEQLGSKKAAKEYILELYLNTISLSHGLNGVEAASQYYFGKHVGDLTLAESASIVGITKHPSKYAPDINKQENKKRQTLVLGNMLEQGYISQRQYNFQDAKFC